MYSFFLLLLKKTYWQMLFSPGIWANAGHSLRRAHKDRRALKQLGRLALLCLIPFLCVAYLAWLTSAGALFLIPVIVLVGWFFRRNAGKDDQASLSIAQKPPPVHREISAEEGLLLREYFCNLALIYAVLLDRAGSEAFLKQKVLPEGVEVVSRRIHIHLLKSHDLWDRIGQADREAMMMPDGAWEWWQINVVSSRYEALRLLRWILRIDFFLPAIGQQLSFNSKLANELVRVPEKLFQGHELATQTMIESARDVAREYLIRCFAEEVNRGYTVPEKEGAKEWAHDLSSRLGGKQSADSVLDGKLVSETDEETLRRATQLSRMRRGYLEWAISVLDGPILPELEVSCFAPREAETALAET
jgi:hypothetical protein